MAVDLQGVQEGMPVRSADGQDLGHVVFCRHEDFLIEAGPFFPRDYQARYRQVGRIDHGAVVLAETGEELRAHVAEARPDGRHGAAEEEGRDEPLGARVTGDLDGSDRDVPLGAGVAGDGGGAPGELRAGAFGDAGLEDEDLRRRG